jgi:hypothetical protein
MVQKAHRDARLGIELKQCGQSRTVFSVSMVVFRAAIK